MGKMYTAPTPPIKSDLKFLKVSYVHVANVTLPCTLPCLAQIGGRRCYIAESHADCGRHDDLEIKPAKLQSLVRSPVRAQKNNQVPVQRSRT